LPAAFGPDANAHDLVAVHAYRLAPRKGQQR
jgi:hypothetical protein